MKKKTHKRPLRIVILGLPGSGKGTQGTLLADALSLPRLSVGALLRRQYELGTRDGILARNYTQQGLAVPARVLMRMLDVWFCAHPEGFVVDNLVRSDEQLEAFKQYQKRNAFEISLVIKLVVPEDKARQWLEQRRKGKAVRHDETQEAIGKRFLTYNQGIRNISSYFERTTICKEINGLGNVQEVHERMYNTVLECCIHGE